MHSPRLDPKLLLPLPLLCCGAGLALALFARHALVEPADLTARCDAAPWQDVTCALRTLTVQSFIHHRVAWAALALALLALATRMRWAAALALLIGSSGLVLYAASLSAPAVLLAALVLARPSAGHAPAEGALR